MHDQEGGLAITMPWEMAQVQNMNHVCSQMKVIMKKKEIFLCVKHTSNMRRIWQLWNLKVKSDLRFVIFITKLTKD
jgi:hypothetical protein